MKMYSIGYTIKWIK